MSNLKNTTGSTLLPGSALYMASEAVSAPVCKKVKIQLIYAAKSEYVRAKLY